MALDSDGFIWYATSDQIIKETGSRSFAYYIRPNPNKPLKELRINSMKFDSKGHLWATTNSFNILVFYPDKGDGHWIGLDNLIEGHNANIVSIHEDNQGNIWLGSVSNYVVKIDSLGQVCKYIIKDSPLENRSKVNFRFRHMEFIETSPNSFIISQLINNKYHYWRYQNDQFIPLKFSQNKFKEEGVTSIIVPHNSVFEENITGVYLYKDKLLQFEYLPEIASYIIEAPINDYNTYKYATNNLDETTIYLTIDNQVFEFEFFENGSNIEMVERNQHHFNGFIEDICIHQFDTFSVIDQTGIQTVKKKLFQPYLQDKINGNKSISTRGIIEMNDGSLLVQSHRGLFMKNPGENAFTLIDFPGLNIKTKASLISGYQLISQGDSIFWAVGFNNNLMKIRLEPEPSVDTFDLDQTYASSTSEFSFSYDIVYDKKQDLIIGGNNGLVHFNTRSSRATKILFTDPSLSLTNIRDLHYSATKDAFLIAANEGLYEMTLVNDSTAQIDRTIKNSIVENNAPFVVDKGRYTWIGYEDNHIIRYNNETDSQDIISYFSDQDITLSELLEVGESLWVSTYNGLYQFDADTLELLKSYFNTDGLTNNEFNRKSKLLTKNNEIFFGGVDGISKYRGSSIINEYTTPELFLIESAQFNKSSETFERQSYNIEANTKFEVPYVNSVLSLTFAINRYANNFSKRYKYRIVEISDSWIDNGNNPNIDLRGLNPNTYTLEVQGFTGHLQPTDVKAYTLIFKKIFYKTTWFIALIILVISVVIFWILRLKYIKDLNALKFEKEIIVLQNKALLAQMNPHFVFNVLNNLQGQILKKNKNTIHYLQKFSLLIRFTLEMSRNNEISIKNELQYLEAYLELEKLRDSDLDYEIVNELENNIADKTIPCMLFQPIVENAIVHGLKPKESNKIVRLVFTSDKDWLIGKVIDNGIGRKASEMRNTTKSLTHESMATAIINERKELFNKNSHALSIEYIDRYDDRKNALGTEVTIKISLKAIDKMNNS